MHLGLILLVLATTATLRLCHARRLPRGIVAHHQQSPHLHAVYHGHGATSYQNVHIENKKIPIPKVHPLHLIHHDHHHHHHPHHYDHDHHHYDHDHHHDHHLEHHHSEVAHLHSEHEPEYYHIDYHETPVIEFVPVVDPYIVPEEEHHHHHEAQLVHVINLDNNYHHHQPYGHLENFEYHGRK